MLHSALIRRVLGGRTVPIHATNHTRCHGTAPGLCLTSFRDFRLERSQPTPSPCAIVMNRLRGGAWGVPIGASSTFAFDFRISSVWLAPTIHFGGTTSTSFSDWLRGIP